MAGYEVGGRRSEVGGRRSDVGNRRWEVGGRMVWEETIPLSIPLPGGNREANTIPREGRGFLILLLFYIVLSKKIRKQSEGNPNSRKEVLPLICTRPIRSEP